MRITAAEKDALVHSVRQADPNARIWLFGSRLDDSKKGGDIDIAVLSPLIQISERIRIRSAIIDRIGDQKIDMVVSSIFDLRGLCHLFFLINRIELLKMVCAAQPEHGGCTVYEDSLEHGR
ncbi:MAG: nucleotidyltransferase domain-containing protein [Treponema sp.]|jgi:predicted nucleotidyltransferase|nr:nucleotidyltransferase domain-containing protein [Treponema sp.]